MDTLIQHQTNDRLFQLALDLSTSHVVITDPHGLVVYANKGAELMTGYTFQEMKDNTPRLWGKCMSHEFYQTMWQHIKEQKKPYIGEIRNRRKNGEYYFALAHITPILDTDNNLLGFIGTEEDITARINAESALYKRTHEIQEEKIKYEAIVNNLEEGVLVFNTHGILQYCNESALRLFNTTKTKVIGTHWEKNIHLFESNKKIAPLNHPLYGVLQTDAPPIISSASYSILYDNGQSICVAVTAKSLVIENSLFGAIMVIRDITQEKHIDHVKTEFVSLASHQLRTPLTTINWYTENLLTGEDGPLNDQQRSSITTVHDASVHMVQLVNALLNVSRLELGTFMVNPTDVDVKQIVQDTISEFTPILAQKDISIQYKNQDTMPHIKLDAKLTGIVIHNIISNAVKYTPKSGSIFISLNHDEQHVTITVQDTGYGIPQYQQSKIFTKLFRADNVQKHSTEGTGLGLYIVKSILEATGGTITFNSEENKGTTFYIKLPRTGMKVIKGNTELLDKC